MNKQEDQLENIMLELRHIKYELELQPIEIKSENRLKELQEGLNIIKRHLDDYEKLSQRQDRVLSKIKARKNG